jgi:superfamily II DNA helicase RecQ
MSMQVEFFSIPVLDPANATAALNRFLATHPQARVEKQLIDVGLNSVWAVCVTLPSSSADFTPTPASNSARSRNQNKVDYRAILPPHQWERFRQLRDLRKQVTTQDGVPAYAMALDEQLAEIVTRRPVSLADLTQIPGFGQARVEKYGLPPPPNNSTPNGSFPPGGKVPEGRMRGLRAGC